MGPGEYTAQQGLAFGPAPKQLDEEIDGYEKIKGLWFKELEMHFLGMGWFPPLGCFYFKTDKKGFIVCYEIIFDVRLGYWGSWLRLLASFPENCESVWGPPTVSCIWLCGSGKSSFALMRIGQKIQELPVPWPRFLVFQEKTEKLWRSQTSQEDKVLGNCCFWYRPPEGVVVLPLFLKSGL